MTDTIRRASLSVAAVLIVCNASRGVMASSVPFDDYFDNLYENGQSLDGTNGWGAKAGLAVVTNVDVKIAPYAAMVPAMETLSNRFTSTYASNVWVDCWIKEVTHVMSAVPVVVNTNQALILYMDTNNQVVVYDSATAGWHICTTDFMNNASSDFTGGTWKRLTVNLNYGTKNAAVFLNGHLLVNELALVNTNSLTSLATVSLESGIRGPTYWDEVWVSTNWPQEIGVTNDLDADGMADSREIHLYGMTARYVGTRLVPSADYPAISSALALAVEGEHVVVSNATYTESAVVSNGVTLTGTNLTGTATNWTMSGAVEVMSGGSVLVSGGEAVFADLTINAGGTVVVSNATVTVNGMTRSGTFTLSSDWQTVVPRAVSFTETFDGFGVGTMLGGLASLGWSVSANSVQVQAAGWSGNGVQCPRTENVNSRVSAPPGAKVWTDLYVQDTNLVSDVSIVQVNSNETIKLCVGRNGYVMVYSGGWLTCSNDAMGDNVDGLWSNGWNRISIFQDYGVYKAAIFLNGRLLKENLGFINSNTMHRVDVEAGVRVDTWFDSLNVTTGVPPALATGIYADIDNDGLSDVLEIQSAGSLCALPRGSIYKIR